jgi:hypothetical protein
VERNLAQRPGITWCLVELLVGQRAEPDIPDQRQAPQPARGLVEIGVSEGGQVCRRRDRRGVPAVGLCRLTGEAGFEFGEVVE